jgi:cell division protein FtsI (penicillin-binding protein 3)
LSVTGLRSRALILAGILACAFGGLIGRLTYLQILRHAELRTLAERQHAKAVTIHPRRGPILDRHGHPLAISTGAQSLFAEPRRLTDPRDLARRLAPVIGEPEAEIRARLESDRGFVWLKRRLTPATAQAVRGLKAQGLGFMPDSMRLYPNRELAAHVIGFEGSEGTGLEGIERAWDSHLAGAPGRAVAERDALGRDVTTAPLILKPATAGAGVSLTIDSTIQHIAEREIDAAYQRTRARAAMAVAMDPRTGEILALAIRPTFNPNSFGLATADEWRNRAVTDPFEPGSTFKVILAAAALEEGIVKPTDQFFGENGVITVARSRIHDWKRFGWLSFAEVLQNSSNVGSIKVGQSLGRERYYRHITAFGFGSPTGVGLPAESRGTVREPQRWSGLSLATLSIGQEISVTALQLVAAFGAVANGGRLMQPQLVRSVLDPDGREVRGFEPRLVRQVISPQVANTLVGLLVNVVDRGTGQAAAIPGHEVGGKTGTAQKLDPATRRYSRAPGVLSFVGFVPARDPRLVMLVLLDEPKNEKWGSEAAAPIFSAIGREVLRHLDVPAGNAAPIQLVAGAPVQLAGVASGRAREPSSTGDGARASSPQDRQSGAMPNLMGQTLREALGALAPLQVEVHITGKGVVKRQVPDAGAPLAPGSIARLTLDPK